MSEKITLLPDKLAERKQQIEGRLAKLAYDRLQSSLVIDRCDDEIATLEARHAEIRRVEGTWQQHEAIDAARQGETTPPGPAKTSGQETGEA